MTDQERSDGARAVVVGVDGSVEASAALRFGIEEARLRKLPLRAIHVWTPGSTGAEAFPFSGGSRGWLTGDGLNFSEIRQAAEELLDTAVAAAAQEGDGVEIETLLVEGIPANVLIGAVGPDDLLVVGSRGRGALAGVLLGSVSARCVHHAPCPVVVVHAPRSTAAGSRRDPAAALEKRAAA
jgi:nucleotide-binding universal stress UspA family protein